MKNRNYIMKKSAICLLTAICTFANIGFVVNAAEEDAAEAPAVQVAAPSRDASSTPIVEIEGYTIDGGMLDSGKEITVNLSLHNTGSATAVSSVMMTFSSASGMAYPVYGSGNQIYVGTIGAGKTKEVAVPISISSSFVGDAVDLTCRFSYTAGTQSMTNESTIIIPKSGGSTIGVKSISVSSHAIVNGKSLLSIGYINQSGSNITDARIVVDGNVSNSSKTIKLDTIYSGKSYSQDCYLTFKEAGEQDVSVSLVYTDVNGEETTMDLGTFGVSVSKEAVLEEDNNSLSTILTWAGRAIAAVAVIGALATAFMFIKKR